MNTGNLSRGGPPLINRAEKAIDENQGLIAILQVTRERARIDRLRLCQDRARRVPELQAITERLGAIGSQWMTRSLRSPPPKPATHTAPVRR
jgi:hypothetical protein